MRSTMSWDRVNPSEYDNRRADSQSTTWWLQPAASVRMRTFRPTRPLVGNGNWRSASRITVRWSAAVLLPALPGSEQHRDGLTGALPAVVDERQQRVEPIAVLERRRVAFCFSECAVTNVASTSTISGWSASMPRSGAS